MCIRDSLLAVTLRDTAKSHILQSDGRYIPRRYLLDGDAPLFDSQAWFLQQGVVAEED